MGPGGVREEGRRAVPPLAKWFAGVLTAARLKLENVQFTRSQCSLLWFSVFLSVLLVSIPFLFIAFHVVLF